MSWLFDGSAARMTPAKPITTHQRCVTRNAGLTQLFVGAWWHVLDAACLVCACYAACLFIILDVDNWAWGWKCIARDKIVRRSSWIHPVWSSSQWSVPSSQSTRRLTNISGSDYHYITIQQRQIYSENHQERLKWDQSISGTTKKGAEIWEINGTCDQWRLTEEKHFYLDVRCMMCGFNCSLTNALRVM